MKNSFLALFIFLSFNASAQLDTVQSNDATFDPVFTKVEIEPSFPGGEKAWKKYVNKRLRYPEEAAANNYVQGVVNLQFIVDTAGAVSEVEVIDGPKELRKESIRLIKESAPWVPAVQNGRKVRAYKKQGITYKLG